MFGFGQKAKLKKMGEELKGASLAEVVEKFADSKLIECPSLAYDKEVAIIFKDNITSEEEQDAELLVPKIKKITADNKLEEGSHNIYLAYNTFENLKMYALDLTLATKFMDNTDEAVNYLFDTWLKVPPNLSLRIKRKAQNASTNWTPIVTILDYEIVSGGSSGQLLKFD